MVTLSKQLWIGISLRNLKLISQDYQQSGQEFDVYVEGANPVCILCGKLWTEDQQLVARIHRNLTMNSKGI
jgi:hypothetical protein